MHRVVPALLIVIGLIHLLPLPGVLGGERLAALYGLGFDEPNLALLMRHRAVLFGLMGAFLLFAAFKPSLHTLALVGAAAGVIHVLVRGHRVRSGADANLERP
jgi:hypothetical protein